MKYINTDVFPQLPHVLELVAEERERQHEKFGEQNHLDIQPITGDPDWTPFVLADRYGIHTAKEATDACDAAFKRGHGDWARILVEECAETVGAALDSEEHVLRELIQVAAVCCAWAEAILRRRANRGA